MAEDIPLGVRRIVYARDSYKCRWCGRMNVGIDLHHVIYRSGGGTHVPENLISLCREHHNLAHSSKTDYQQLLLDVLGMEPNVTVMQLMRWREAEAKPTEQISPGQPEGRVRRFLDLD